MILLLDGSDIPTVREYIATRTSNTTVTVITPSAATAAKCRQHIPNVHCTEEWFSRAWSERDGRAWAESTLALAREIDQGLGSLGGYNLAEAYVNTIYWNYVKTVIPIIEGCIAAIGNWKPRRLVLVGGNQRVEYFSVFFAEGERPRQLLYRRSWMVNYYVAKVVTGLVEVEWLKQTPRVALESAKVARRRGIAAVRLLGVGLNALLRRRRRLAPTFQHDSGASVTFLARKAQQVDSLADFYRGLAEDGRVDAEFAVFTPASGISSRIRPPAFMKYVDLNSMVSLRDLGNVLRGVRSVQRRKHQRTVVLRHGGVSVPISVAEVVDELGTSWAEQLVRVRALDKYVTQRHQGPPRVCVTTELIDQSAAFESMWARQRSIPLVTIQHIASPGEPIPQPYWSDRVFTIGRNDAAVGVPCTCIGPAWLDKVYRERGGRHPVEILGFFDQPDDYSEASRAVARSLVMFCAREGLRLIIKPHPRSRNMGFYRQLAREKQQVAIVPRNHDSRTVVSKVQIAVGFTSTALLQAVVAGSITVSVRTHQRSAGPWFVQHDAVRKVDTIEELAELLRNYDEAASAFSVERARLLDDELCGYKGDGIKRWCGEMALLMSLE